MFRLASHPTTDRRPRGAVHAFTLIELLIVIVIIAVLVALLFPVFTRAQERGRQTTCLSNLKQIGTAILTYTDDNDEMLPRAWRITLSVPGGPGTLPQVLNGEVRSATVFACPSDEGNKVFYSGFPNRFWQAKGLSYNYPSAAPDDATPRAQWGTIYPDTWPTWRGGRRRAEFRNPAAVGLVSDLFPWHHVTDRNNGGSASVQAQAGYNVIYLDGHARLTLGAAHDKAMGQVPDPNDPTMG